MNNTKVNYPYINLIKSVAAMAVVLIHVFPNPSNGIISQDKMLPFDVMRACMFSAVILFAMVTGALLFPREESVSKTLKRTVRLVLTLFIFGTAMSALEEFFTTRQAIHSILVGVEKVFMGETWDVMWYLYVIIGIYLLLPIFRAFVNKADKKTMLYILGVLFVFNSVIYTIENAFNIKVTGFKIPNDSIFVFYALWGYYLHTHFNKKVKNVYLIAAIIGVIAIFAQIFLMTDKGTASYLTGCSSPLMIIFATALFLLAKNLNYSNKFVDVVARNSFGIYVVHSFFIHAINLVLNIYPENYNMFISVPLMWLFVFGFTFASCVIMKKIPKLKELL